MIDYVEIITAASLAWLWTTKLTDDDMIFGWWPGFVSRNFGGKMKYPLYYCSTCVCGFWYLIYQVVLWEVYAETRLSDFSDLVLAMAITEMITRKFI